MAGQGMRCAPLCQHPGCWNSSLKAGHDNHKNSEYYYYLSELLSRRGTIRRPQVKDGTFTSDGLPTLKVQTVDQSGIEHAVDSEMICRRSKTLPPIQLCSKTQYDTGNHKRSLSDKLIRQKPVGVKFLEMNLQVDNSDHPSTDQLRLEQLTFSPVLIWKPSSRHSQASKHNATTHTQSLSAPTEQQPDTTGVPVKDSSNELKDGGGRKSPLLTVKTTDLTHALPGSVTEEKKVSSSHRKNKGKRRLPLGDTESFSYLGDIPPHVVAEILQQLRSESSSNIDASRSLSLKQQNYSKPPDGPLQPGHINPAINNNTPHLPSSIAYDLSSKKMLSRTKKKPQLQTTTSQRRRVSSFSRELSKHPLEVLKRRSVFGGWVQHNEQRRNVIDYEPRANEDTLTDATTTKSSSPQKSMYVTTTTLEPPIAVMNRNRHMNATRLSHVSRDSQQHTTTNAVHREQDDGGSPLISPRRINMDLSVSFRDTSSSYPHPGDDHHDESTGRYARVKPPIVHLPRHHLSISASSHKSTRTMNYYSEDESSFTTPEHTVELIACGESVSSKAPPVTRFSRTKPEPIVENRTSVSPDYMLVGVHFTGDHLVLSDRGGNVVHHDLNDTESDATIGPLSEANIAEPEQDIPKIESFDSKELLVEKPTSGVCAPPSTAAEEVRHTESEKVSENNISVQDTIICEESEGMQNSVGM